MIISCVPLQRWSKTTPTNPTHLIHDHLLGPPAPLAPLHDGLQEPQVLDVPALLNAADEVLDLRLCHLAAQVGIVQEDLGKGLRLNKLQRMEGRRCIHEFLDRKP